MNERGLLGFAALETRGRTGRLGGDSRTGHLHQRELLRIHAGGGVLHLEELLFDGASQDGCGAHFAGFQFVVGRDAERLRRCNGESVVLGMAREAAALSVWRPVTQR